MLRQLTQRRKCIGAEKFVKATFHLVQVRVMPKPRPRTKTGTGLVGIELPGVKVDDNGHPLAINSTKAKMSVAEG
jgi:hypothetical protein